MSLDIQVARETYIQSDNETRHGLTYDLLSAIFEEIKLLRSHYEAHIKPCDDRFRLLESAKKRDLTVSGLLGFIGGFIAHFGEKFIGGK